SPARHPGARPRPRRAQHGHERRLRGSHRGRRDDGTRGNGALRGATAKDLEKLAAREDLVSALLVLVGGHTAAAPGGVELGEALLDGALAAAAATSARTK